MPTDPTTTLDDAFLAILHHDVFEMTAEQAAALMTDDPNPFVCDGLHNTGGILATGGIAGPVKNAAERCQPPYT